MAEPFSSQENEAIGLLDKIAAAIDSSNNTKQLTTASPLARGKKYIAKGQRTTTASYTTNVSCGHYELSKFINAEDNSSKYMDSFEEIINSHHTNGYYAFSSPKPVGDRELHQSFITKREDEKVIKIVSVPCFIEEKVKERPLRPDRVRAEIRSMYKLTKLSNNITRIEHYAELEFGGLLPRWLINRDLPKFMSAPTRWQEHFQHLRALLELGPEDGVAMGTMLTTLVKNRKSVESRLTAFVSKNVAL